jgi:hypothetical protein
MKCRCCGSNDLQMILDLSDQPWGNDYAPLDQERKAIEYSLRLWVCKECMMSQIDSTIPKEIMFVNHTYVSGTTKSLKNHFVEVGKSIIEKNKLGQGNYLLDIGGNDGTFLEFFKESGIDVLNVDSGKLQAEISNSKNIPCINKFFNEDTAKEILQSKGHATVIHGSGIFFHLEELHSVFKGLKLLLDPYGVIVAEFIYLPGMLGNCAYDQIYHEHLLYYSLLTFQRLLSQFDLEIFDAELKPIHGGSCIAYAGHKGKIQLSDRYLKLQENEINNGIDKFETYFKFHDEVEKNKKKLLEMLQELKKKGLKVQALGAPVKGSTIINYCKLTSDLIECGVEINPHKFNTYFPGTTIPVYDQNNTPEPDVYLLLAWNFKEEILSKLSDFREKGGKILVPIPSPELI